MEIYTDEFYMNEALKQASYAYEEGEIPIGAVVVCKNKIIAKAYNQTEKLTDVTAHAEMLALTAASDALGAKYLPECKMYVTLEPCPMCAGALFWAQIGALIFGAPDLKRGYRKASPSLLHPKTKVHNGLFAEKSTELIQLFFKNLRN